MYYCSLLILTGSGLSPDGSGGSQYSTNVPLSGLPPNNSTFSPNMMPKSLPIPPLDPTQLINMVNAAVTKMDFPLMIDAQQQVNYSIMLNPSTVYSDSQTPQCVL